jgi:mono/diheme cytochrome c family protein
MMNIRRYLIIGLLMLVGVLAVSACSPQTSASAAAGNSENQDRDDQHADDEHDEADTHDDEHMEADDEHMDGMDHMHVAAPAEFAALANPFAGDHEAIEAGEETFNTLCASCHGPQGQGDGVAAEDLDPKPATLADGMMMDDLSDGYLFWRVSKGGAMEPFNSAMPAWESGLTEEQRWQVISYVRTLAGDEDGHMGETHMDDEHMDDGHDE